MQGCLSPIQLLNAHFSSNRHSCANNAALSCTRNATSAAPTNNRALAAQASAAARTQRQHLDYHLKLQYPEYGRGMVYQRDEQRRCTATKLGTIFPIHWLQNLQVYGVCSSCMRACIDLKRAEHAACSMRHAIIS